MQTEKDKAQFDPNFSPKNEQNRRAARDRGWRYDPKKKKYVDSEAALVADRFGQPF